MLLLKSLECDVISHLIAIIEAAARIKFKILFNLRVAFPVKSFTNSGFWATCIQKNQVRKLKAWSYKSSLRIM